jgi:hypothetical protein
MKKLLLALSLLGLLCAPAYAQKTKSVLTTEVNTNLPDNTAGIITPATVRTTLIDMINSWGGLVDATNTFSNITISTPLPVASGGTGDAGTAWTAFTLSPVCGTATFTVNSARAKTLGKTTWVESDFSITTLGTCTNSLTVNIHNTSNSSFVLTMFNQNINVVGNCIAGPGATTVQCIQQASTIYAAGHRLVTSGVYENQ